MNITITSAEKEDYLLVNSAGALEDMEDLFKQARLIYNEIKKYDKKKILVDDRETRFPLNLFYYYQQVEFFRSDFPPEIRLWKIAVILPPEYAEIGKFWETVCVNRGFQYFAFTSFDEASRWLMEQED